MANAPSMQGEYPQQNDKKYWSGGSFNQALYDSDLQKYQQSLSGTQLRPDAVEGTLKDIYANTTDGVGAGTAPKPGPVGIGATPTYLKDIGPVKGDAPTKVDRFSQNYPMGQNGPLPVTPGAPSSPASSTPTTSGRSPADDTTNDGGSSWSLGPSWKAVTDPELRHWSPEHQAAAQAAHDAKDEAGFNGVKEYVRGQRATGGTGYRGSADASYNPNNTPDSAYAGMSLKDVLALGGDQDYESELSGFSNQDQQDWISAYMRGATAQGQQIVDKNRKK
jgi:hypothetical protein